MSGNVAPFRRPVQIRFRDCDAAGIVFFPRYFDMLNDLVEDWFADALGWSFTAMHGADRAAIPTAELQCRFLAPARLGDTLVRELAVARLGNTSCTLQVRFVGTDGHDRLEISQRLVCVNAAAGLTPQPFPAPVREAMSRYCLPAQASHSWRDNR